MQLKRYFFLLLLVCIAFSSHLKAQVSGNADSVAVKDSIPYGDSIQNTENKKDSNAKTTIKPPLVRPIQTNDPDSLLLFSTRYFFYTPFEFNISKPLHLDYDQTQCHQPDAVLKFDRNYYAHQENAGRSHYNLFFQPQTGNTFRYQPSTFTAYLFTLENIKFYQLEKPYSELQFFNSLGGEYFFNAIHSQNLLPNWNFAFEDHLISSAGNYSNTSVLDNVFNITTNFFSRNGRYKLRAAYIYNYLKQQENGGIAVDSLFTQNIQTTRDAIPVNLQKASTRWREINTFVEQLFSFHKPDTVKGKGSPFNIGAIGYNIRFHRGYRIYSDQQPNYDFYRNFYIDSTKSYDSSGFWKIENTLFWTNDVYHNHLYRNPFRLTLGARHQIVEAIDTRDSERLLMLSPFAKLQMDFGKLVADFSAEYTMGNKYNDGDYLISGMLAYQLIPKNELKLTALLSGQDPEYFYSSYHSNNFMWAKSFDKVQAFNLSAEYTWNKMVSFGLAYYNYSNALYLDENVTPYQHTQSESLWQIYTGEKLKWGIFHFDNFAALQIADNKDVFCLPLLEFKQSYYVQFWTFKKALQLQTGFELRYNTAFYGNAYSPALAAFYRQTEIETGNNLWLDFFISGRIKRAFLFIKFAHINALFDNTPNYYMIPHYPTQDFAFKWGFIWKFFD